jgi:hypothetical protein
MTALSQRATAEGVGTAVLLAAVVGSGIMGAVALREFALALLVGLVTGSYSSIFIAAPILTMFKEAEPRFKTMRGQHATGMELERLVLGGSPESVDILITDVKRENWATGGKLWSEPRN